MPIGVSAPHRDHGQSGADARQPRRRGRRVAAVVGHLQHIRLQGSTGGQQRLLGGRLDVAGQQDPPPGPFHPQHQRAVVDAPSGPAGGRRAQHLDGDRPQSQPVPPVHHQTGRRSRPAGFLCRHQSHLRVGPDQGIQASGVIGVGVGDRRPGQAPHASSSQEGRQLGAPAAGIDGAPDAARSAEGDGVALTDVEKDDLQMPGRQGRRAQHQQRRQPQGGDQETAGPAGLPAAQPLGGRSPIRGPPEDPRVVQRGPPAGRRGDAPHRARPRQEPSHPGDRPRQPLQGRDQRCRTGRTDPIDQGPRAAGGQEQGERR